MSSDSQSTTSVPTSSVDDLQFGRRDERGHWAPFKKLECAPVFIWPPRPAEFVRWLIMRYIFSWNLAYAAVAVLFWLFLSPSIESAKTLSAGWIGLLLVRNSIAVKNIPHD